MTNVRLTESEPLYLPWNFGDCHLVIIWYLMLGAWLFLLSFFLVSEEVL
jgi:hypothetical protein